MRRDEAKPSPAKDDPVAMAPADLEEPTLAPSVKPALVVFLMVLFIALIGALSIHVTRQLQRLEDAASGSVLWALTQAELEASRLETETVRHLAAPGRSLEDLRIRFDVFFSRIAIIRENANYDSLRTLPDSQAALQRIDAFFETWVPAVDGPDDALRAQIPAFAEAAAVMRAQTRILSLDGITRNATESSSQRTSIASTLTRIAWLMAILVAVLLVMLAVLFHFNRTRDAQARRNTAMRRRLETIIGTALDAVVVTDTEGRIVEFNGAAEHVFGYSRQEAIGAPVGDLIVPPERREAQTLARLRYLAEPPEQRQPRFVTGIEAIRKNGERFPVETSIASAPTPEGDLFIAFLRDISKRVEAENELLEARDKAIAGERSKERLLAVMSHEMRTPLNGILGTLELMGTKDFSADQVRFLEIIRNSSKNLLDQVNDVLDLSRLDANKVQIDKRIFDLVALFREIVDSQLGAAAANGNRLTLVPPSPALHEVWSDPDRLRQILLNLLSNAIKFTKNGQISIEIDCTSGLDEVEIRVTDSGIGIAEADLERIFGDFIMLDSSYQRTTKGTGLGLGIAKRLARALGGELGAESEPGDGTVFWLRLPLDPPPDLDRTGETETGERQTKVAASAAMSALIVEDNAVNRLILRRMLESDGHSVTEAFDGREGVERARKTRFDIIFMDISMPGMDGVTATRTIRETCPLNAETPIIATTAHALPEEQRAFAEAGMQTVLLKPLTRQALRRAFAESQQTCGTLHVVPGRLDAPLLDGEHLDELALHLSPEEKNARLQVFRQEIEAFLETADTAADPDQTAQSAHRLAGSAGLFGALCLASHLQQIEAQVREASDEERRGLTATARTCWHETARALNAKTSRSDDPDCAAE
ncbi:hybrid sensor histidine kinase/response regulator [Pacificoceanicola onchidii]|uniref:hybrid sensor histidine kinase/response regulator n=1 Tax=Pacificoceanicola onchidii TaxID=2562685 RepID=UPI0010A359AE|nr:PAS domain-containing hybrid sensor histidine kinase/response regulator [Pacificoceanicola onchidii]